MRPVDINWMQRDGSLGAEVWVTYPRARSENPANLDAEWLSADRTPGMRPCLVAMPGPIEELERRVVAHRAAGAPGVVRICPGPEGHGYPLEPWALSPLPEYCEREDLALVIDVGAPAAGAGFPWAEIVRFARAYPGLAIAALAAPLVRPTAARALDVAPNLVLETSALSKADAAEFAELVRSHGAYRFAYGSGAGGSDTAFVAGALDAADADVVLAGTASHLAEGTWGATYL
jgi:hypothetical protein